MRIDEDIVEVVEVKKFDTYSKLVTYYNGLSNDDKKRYIYEADGKQYIDYINENSRSLRKVNQYRDLVRDKEKDTIELKIVPVQMEVGRSFLEDFGTSSTMLQCFEDVVRIQAAADPYDGKPSNVQDLIDGNVSLESGRDIVELAMNDGVLQRWSWVTWPPGAFVYPWPFVLTDDLKAGEVNRGFSFELNPVKGVVTMYDLVYGSTVQVNTQSELQVQFETNKMYNPMSLFIIHCKPYICKQIEYKVESEGIYPLKTGYFYEVT